MSDEVIVSIENQPKLIKRDSNGLLEGVKYVYTAEGLVDWRAMVDKKHLIVNKFNFERFGKPVPPTIEGVEDKNLLILLSGIKELLNIRGYLSVEYKITCPSIDYVCAVCSVKFISNFETENKEVVYSGVGDSHSGNTNSFGKNFLGPIAENRAFVRAVRNFLRINIISQEEVGGNSPQEESSNLSVADSLLLKTMNECGVQFNKIKAKLVEEKVEGAEKFESVQDIPNAVKFSLVERIKKKAAAAVTKKS